MSVPAAPPPPAESARPSLAGLVAMGVWVLIGIGFVAYLVQTWDPSLFQRYGLSYLSGLRVTVSLVVVSFACGALISLPVAMGRMSANRIVQILAFAYVYFFRGTPLIAQIFLVYYGFGQFHRFFESLGVWWFFREAWYCGLFSLALNTAAYQAEILRGAIESVPRGQLEGGRSLALPSRIVFFKVVLPQALIVALRPYANEFILMVKASAIVAIITVYDLFGVARQTYSRTFDFQSYVWAALLYLSIVQVLGLLVNLAERRLTRHLER